jgi:diguanylate cyclase (GGDEF)-like protein/PAS domain S-box-containing protein
MAAEAIPWGEMILNLPENSGSEQQIEILDALPALVFLEREGRIVFANAEARQMLGLAEGEWAPRPVEDVLWGLYPGTAEPQTTLTASRRGSPFHATLPAKNGRLYPVEGTCSILDAASREAVIVAHPSGREKAPRSRLMEDVLASLPEAVVIVYGKHALYSNPAFSRLFGFTAEEVSGANPTDLVVPETRKFESAMLEKAVDEQGHAAIETVRVHRDGDLVDVAMMASPLLVDGKKTGYVFTYRDIGERKQIEAKLQHDAMHDVLTSLPNRALFIDRLSIALRRRTRRRDQTIGVLFIDLDRFKEINDTLGHAAGDSLLTTVADRLRSALRPQDTAARLGGDEFGVLVENILMVSDIETVAKRILNLMNRPFDIFGHSIDVGASIGVAMAGPDHIAPEMLLRDADFAMYRAKQGGGGRFEVFDKNLEMHITSEQERERELRQVLDRKEYETWYQPIFRLEDGKLEAFESLLRWRKSNGSTESFRDLLSVAEDTGLSIGIGRETLEAACRQLCCWTAALARPDLTMSVNLTQRQLLHPDLVGQVQKILDLAGADPARLQFEVAESTLTENAEAATAVLHRLAECNVGIAIDNFGSRLAPLSHLLNLPISVLKLDPKLTLAAAAAGRDRAMVESIVRLAHTLGMQVVAQGIETPEQLEAICRLGCEMGQGHLLSYPMAPANIAKLPCLKIRSVG